MLKQLDTIGILQNKLVVLSHNPQVIEYLETKKTVDSLKSIVKKSIIEHMIVKPNGFGQRATLKSFEEVSMLNSKMSKDRKLYQGALKGEKYQAYIKLSHRSSYEVKPTSILRIDQWSN